MAFVLITALHDSTADAYTLLPNPAVVVTTALPDNADLPFLFMAVVVITALPDIFARDVLLDAVVVICPRTDSVADANFAALDPVAVAVTVALPTNVAAAFLLDAAAVTTPLVINVADNPRAAVTLTTPRFIKDALPFLFNAIDVTVAFPDSVADPDLLPFLFAVALMKAFDERTALPLAPLTVAVITALPIKLADISTVLAGGNDVICARPDGEASAGFITGVKLIAVADICALLDNVALAFLFNAVAVTVALPDRVDLPVLPTFAVIVALADRVALAFLLDADAVITALVDRVALAFLLAFAVTVALADSKAVAYRTLYATAVI
jgi:hypothetical protein